MQQSQSHSQYYDKLLHHLNRTFSMNMKAQQLFLDLTKQTKTIRFKSIKNIYHTLTEGKADEVIYQKDKKQLINNHVFNQKYQPLYSRFTQRTCWRIIEKMVNKVAFYLSHEKILGSIAPSILKIVAFLRTANEKINNRASFVMFFQEVLDCIIAENNILQEKVYDLLIKRGYIYSIDEFYRLNRFEGSHDDYICPEEGNGDGDKEIKEEDDEYSLEVAGRSIDTSSVAISKRSRSKFGGFSSKRFALHRTKTNYDENIPEVSEVNASESQSQSSSEGQAEMNAEQFNRLSHQIHQQMEKTVDELLNNHNFDHYMSSNKSEEHVSSAKDANAKPSVVKQVLKNLKNRNFKANQKILIINHNDIDTQEERKNSSQTLLKKRNTKKEAMSMQRNRTSIAVALTKGMKERVFKNEHLADIEDLIINNLDRLESGIQSRDNHRVYQNKNHLSPITKRNMFSRSKVRQQTQNLEVDNVQLAAFTSRRSSNLHFLNNAFNFQGKVLPKNSCNQVRRISNFGPECNMSEISSNLTIETVSYQDRQQLINRYISNPPMKKSSRNNKNSHMSNTSIGISRFASEQRQDQPKQNRFCIHQKTKTEELSHFNPTLLKITVQKYNKCITQQPESMEGMEMKEFGLFESGKEMTILKTASTLDGQAVPFTGYKHHRRFDTYDRRLRRML